MMNAVQPIAKAQSASARTGFVGSIRQMLTRLLPSALIYTVILIGIITVMKYAGGPVDYVGPDNDDGMRLVEVRDFLKLRARSRVKAWVRMAFSPGSGPGGSGRGGAPCPLHRFAVPLPRQRGRSRTFWHCYER